MGALIENAKPIVTHVMETLAAGQNLNDPKVKNQIARSGAVDRDLPNPANATRTVSTGAMLRVDERAFIGTQAQGPRVRRPRRRPDEERQPVDVQVIKPSARPIRQNLTV
jgi:DNA primase